MKAFLPAHGRRMGFRAFTRTPEFQKQLAAELQEAEAERRQKAKAAGVEYLPQELMLAMEAIKSRAWKALSDAERERWRDQAKAVVGATELTE